MSMKKLFVGNLSWKATEEQLRELFEPFGEVASVKIVNDQYTGRSKGFAFIEMGDTAAVEKAIQELNNKPFMERNLRVSLALERTERRDSEGGGGGGGFRKSNYGSRDRSFRS